jgi:hypothetical protein
VPIPSTSERKVLTHPAACQSWTFTLFAHNVGNERAQVSAINSAQYPPALLTVQPRRIGLTASRDF